MSIISRVKEIAGQIKNLGDPELYRKIVELEGCVVELTKEKQALEEQNEQLKHSLEFRKETWLRRLGPIRLFTQWRAYLVPVVVCCPSLIWIALDKTAWPWDQAWYAKGSTELFYTLIYNPSSWWSTLLSGLSQKAPGIAWVGQFFVPLGYLLGSIDVGLLLSILVTQALTLMLVFKSVEELSGGEKLIAIAGCIMVASAPLFIGLSHQFLVEPMQTLAVAWFASIMTFAPKWNRAFILSQLVAATSFAMLAKVSSPLYCCGPGLVALSYAFKPRLLYSGSDWRQGRVIVTLAFGIVLSFAGAAWYLRNIKFVVDYVALASTGAVAELYGKNDTFLNSMIYWLDSLQESFFLPSFLILSGAIVAGGVVRHLVKPNSSLRYFTLCSVIGFLQIVVALSVFSFSPNRDRRYLLPLLPYVAILVCWALTQINKAILTGLVAIIFTIQLIMSHAIALTILPPNIDRSGWLYLVNTGARETTTLIALVNRTCMDKSPLRYYNTVGVEKPWLNLWTLSYIAAKKLAPSNVLNCSYASLGYVESDADKMWKHILALQSRYYITTDPNLYPIPSDPVDQAINQLSAPILERIRTSGLYEQEPPLPEDPGILIFHRK